MGDVFSVEQGHGIVVSFGKALMAPLWKGLWIRNMLEGLQTATQLWKFGGVKSPVLGLNGKYCIGGARVPDPCSQHITSGSGGSWN